jgi:hypothetical protein
MEVSIRMCLALLSSSGLEEITKSVPQIIEEASKTPLGILALIILILGGLAYAFFRSQGPRVTLPVFAALLLGAAIYAYAASGVPTTEYQFSGRVSEADSSALPIRQAKISLEGADARAPVYTDSEGTFVFTLVHPKTGYERLVVNADGHETYDLNISGNLEHVHPDIRLRRNGAGVALGATPGQTADGSGDGIGPNWFICRVATQHDPNLIDDNFNIGDQHVFHTRCKAPVNRVVTEVQYLGCVWSDNTPCTHINPRPERSGPCQDDAHFGCLSFQTNDGNYKVISAKITYKRP